MDVLASWRLAPNGEMAPEYPPELDNGVKLLAAIRLPNVMKPLAVTYIVECQVPSNQNAVGRFTVYRWLFQLVPDISTVPPVMLE